MQVSLFDNGATHEQDDPQTESHESPPAAPNKRSGRPALTTRLMNAYRHAVTSRGWKTNNQKAQEHLKVLKEAGCQPEQVEQVIAWATEGQDQRRAYPLQRLPDDFLSWQANQQQDQRRATPPLPAEPDDEDAMSASELEARRQMEARFPGYFDEDPF
jgi:hypothetical protein